eukprot:TRINITY_DN29891_c0_g2_i1.p1 TRINITY_DN29891_c0_g2~~TRINITY_DN29891_c0_g2_i1.p1  ORF type:complete len:499 (+),score=63.73 TRINITY_DN29891_c0_g2_i1:72-1499(+)
MGREGCQLQQVLGCRGAAEVGLYDTVSKGRVLRAMRDVGPDAVILTCPLEHQVVCPGDDADVPDGSPAVIGDAAVKTSSCMANVFSEVKRICQDNGFGFGCQTYWAALLSLTAEEVPLDSCWPSISVQTQSRILQLLFTPSSISSLRAARSTLEEKQELPDDFDIDSFRADIERGRAEYPKRCAQTVPTVDDIVCALCTHFALRISSEKLEKLVLCWKYNSFQASVPSSAGPGANAALELYIAAAMASHSCVPNCYWWNGDDGSFELLSGDDGLVQHEEACISYLDKSTRDDNDTLSRRDALASSWLFFCECDGCAAVGRPTCPRCTRMQSMDVVMCGAEEPLYPGFETNCDGCSKQDLHCNVGYFFHCPACPFDFCAGCALKSTAALKSSIPGALWNGCWTNRNDPGARVEGILSDTIVWATGKSTRLFPQDATHFFTWVEDKCSFAEFIDDQLIWNDDEVWVRASSPFEKLHE